MPHSLPVPMIFPTEPKPILSAADLGYMLREAAHPRYRPCAHGECSTTRCERFDEFGFARDALGALTDLARD